MFAGVLAEDPRRPLVGKVSGTAMTLGDGATFTCSGCGLVMAIPEHGVRTSATVDGAPGTRLALRRVRVPPDPLAVKYGVTKFTEWAAVCSPACWQKLVDDPSWEHVVLPQEAGA
jgi:hypothetical protein